MTDIGFTGQYQLQGSGLSVVNLSGRDILHKNEEPGLHAAATHVQSFTNMKPLLAEMGAVMRLPCLACYAAVM
mgnify:FL=1